MKKYVVTENNKIKKILVCPDGHTVPLAATEELHEACEVTRYRLGTAFAAEEKEVLAEEEIKSYPIPVSDYITYGILTAAAAISGAVYYFTYGAQ